MPFPNNIPSLEVNRRSANHLIAQSFDTAIILPSNFEHDQSDFVYASSSFSFYKYVKESLPLSFLTEPELLMEQRSGEWFAPTILLSSEFIARHPTSVAIICKLSAQYVYDSFKGRFSKPKADLKIIHQKTSSLELTEFHYRGDVSGLSEVKDAVAELCKKD